MEELFPILQFSLPIIVRRNQCKLNVPGCGWGAMMVAVSPENITEHEIRIFIWYKLCSRVLELNCTPTKAIDTLFNFESLIIIIS